MKCVFFHPLLGSKLPVSHQVDLVGEVHGHGQFDQQVDTEAVAALRHDGTPWKKPPTFMLDVTFTGFNINIKAEETFEELRQNRSCILI